MANQPRADNPGRVIRIDDQLWTLVRVAATELEVTPSEVVRAAIRAYLDTT